ncbi:hypothetical protein EYF80_003849 [Liparis tanakae]|uniref:Uncharacterized protein n=1 Tax=Liparis tanakae TaxID=230148 RepID=A0A4Z2J6I3_9TELE|nr:hypothetical protein EYF80_003849 [Liparis tanakae]
MAEKEGERDKEECQSGNEIRWQGHGSGVGVPADTLDLKEPLLLHRHWAEGAAFHLVPLWSSVTGAMLQMDAKKINQPIGTADAGLLDWDRRRTKSHSDPVNKLASSTPTSAYERKQQQQQRQQQGQEKESPAKQKQVTPLC